jgi:hypothetical protein
MRSDGADIHDGQELKGSVNRPIQKRKTNFSKSSFSACNARPVHTRGYERRLIRQRLPLLYRTPTFACAAPSDATGNRRLVRIGYALAMASPVNAAVCALLAIAFWSSLGYAVGRHLLPHALARGAAPVVGWAVHSAAMLPIYPWIGFSPLAVLGAGALYVCGAVLLWRRAPPDKAVPAADIPGLGVRRRGGSGADAGGRHPAEILRRRRAARRPDLRSFEDRHHRCDDAARPAAGQSGVRRIRRARPRLLLSLAFQRALAASASGWEAA